MKLSALPRAALLGALLAGVLATTGTASADELFNPPGGPVHVPDAAPTERGPDALQRGIRGAIRRYDRNGDGDLGPGELPPAAARRLRRLDRDGDGWVEPGEY